MDCPKGLSDFHDWHPYPTERVDKVGWQKSIPAQIRQLVLYIINNKGQVDVLLRELTFENNFINTFCEIHPGTGDVAVEAVPTRVREAP